MSREVPSYVSKVLSKFEGVRETASGWECFCPVPSHGSDGHDRHPSFHITIGEAGRILLFCRVGCSFTDILQATELTAFHLRPNPFSYEEPMKPIIGERGKDATPEDLDGTLDRVYRSLLGHLGLEKEHRRNLLGRGLIKAEQDLRGYRTLRATEAPRICSLLYSEYGDLLYQVPGFCEKDGRPLFSGDPWGMLVPVQSADRKLAAIKVRRESDPKYVYLSSTPTGGRSPGAPIHCPIPPLGESFQRVRVTEGELKADIATIKSSTYTISIPGVTNWWRAIDTLRQMKTGEVLVSFDWRDVRLKTPVAEQCLSFLQTLDENGFSVGIETWDPVVKGIDDALESEIPIQETWGIKEVIDILRKQPSLMNQAVEIFKEKEWDPLPFPMNVFPEPVRDFIRDVSEALPCPQDFVGVGCLVVAASSVGNSRRIQPEQGWYEKPILYAAIIGPPGSLKTPSLKKTMAPLGKRQQQLIDSQKVAEAEYQKKLEKWKAEKSVWSKEAKVLLGTSLENELPPQPEKPLPPFQQYVLLGDVTMEKVAEVMQQSPRGGLQFVDELTALINSMNQYKGGKGADKQNYLSLWDGSRIQVDRKSSKQTLYVESPYLSVLGGIQPDLLGDLEESKGREDGFTHRILFAMPKVDPVPPLTGKGVPKESSDRWEQVVTTLLQYQMEEGEGSQYPKEVLLSSEAYQKFHDWHENVHRKESREEGFPSFLGGPWSKLKAYFVRISLVLYMLRKACFDCGLCPDDPGEEVGLVDVEGAEKMIEYFKAHMKGVYQKFLYDADDKKITDFVGWLKSNGGCASVESVQINGERWGLKGKTSVRKFLWKVADRGFGHFSKEKGATGRVKEIFCIGKEEFA